MLILRLEPPLAYRPRHKVVAIESRIWMLCEGTIGTRRIGEDEERLSIFQI